MNGGPGGANVGRNPTNGAVVYFTLAAKPDSTSDVTMDVLDSAGTLIRSFTTRRRGVDTTQVGRIVRDSLKAGMNRFVWNMRYPDATTFQNLIMWAGGVAGPEAVPGLYQVRLTAPGSRVMTQSFRIVPDPRLHVSPQDYARQFELLNRINAKLSDANGAVVRIRGVRSQLDQVMAKLDSANVSNARDIRSHADSLRRRMASIEEQVYQVKNRSGQDPLNYPIRLNNRLAALARVVASADARPTDQSYEVFDALTAELNVQMDRLRVLLQTDIPAFNAQVRAANLPALVVPEPAVP